MEKIVRTMMQLIACEVCGRETDNTLPVLGEAELTRLYRLSKAHDLAHLAGDVLIRNDLIPDGEIKEKFEKQLMMAVLRYERSNYELLRLKPLFNEAGIPFLPLKGSVLRQYYPEPWMRTSCDIDILIHEEDLDRAITLLEGAPGYRAESRQSHDVGLYAPSGVHLELHYTLLEDHVVGDADKVLETVWARCEPEAELPCCYRMPDALFYYYHIVHMVKHFQIGGCGVRPFLDIWVMKHRSGMRTDGCDALLRDAGLDIFAAEAERLSRVWFEGGEHSELSRQMERYLLGGGVYGSVENRVAVQQVKEGGKFRYLLSRIWLPYRELKYQYPSLEGRRWLLLFYEIRRWCRLMTRDGARRGAQELKLNSATDQESQNDTKRMLSLLHLE